MIGLGASVSAKLLKRDTADGVSFVRDEVPIGRIYTVYPSTLRMMRWGQVSLPGVVIDRLSVWGGPSDDGHGGWMPIELLEPFGDLQ